MAFTISLAIQQMSRRHLQKKDSSTFIGHVCLYFVFQRSRNNLTFPHSTGSKTSRVSLKATLNCIDAPQKLLPSNWQLFYQQLKTGVRVIAKQATIELSVGSEDSIALSEGIYSMTLSSINSIKTHTKNVNSFGSPLFWLTISLKLRLSLHVSPTKQFSLNVWKF